MFGFGEDSARSSAVGVRWNLKEKAKFFMAELVDVGALSWKSSRGHFVMLGCYCRSGFVKVWLRDAVQRAV